MRGKDDDQSLDSSEIKISIFILSIRFDHSTCNAHPIRPHKIKRVAHYYRLHIVGDKNMFNIHILLI
jgi:hypothetical protein